jgi:hypothetical protein
MRRKYIEDQLAQQAQVHVPMNLVHLCYFFISLSEECASLVNN